MVISSDSRSRLIQAATELFQEEGYGASVDRIAARAGVAKQTLYNHFPHKDDLFGEVARNATASILGVLEAGPADIRAALMRFAAAYRGRALSDGGLALYRTISGKMERAPGLAREVFATCTDKTAKDLASFLESAMAKRRLRRDDARFAAEMLMSMLIALDRPRRLAGRKALSAKAEAERVSQIVDCFLRAFAS